MDPSEYYEYAEYAEGEEYAYAEDDQFDETRDWGDQEGAWGEIAVAPIFHDEIVDVPTVLRFDAAEECLWTGTHGGVVAQSLSPDLARYACIAAHPDGIIASRSSGMSCITLSPSQLSLHYSGCAPRFWYADPTADLAAVEFEPRGHRVLLGRSGGGITSFDLVAGKPGGTITTNGQGVVALSGPLPRGVVVMGTAEGRLTLLDVRNSLRQESTLVAHNGGFAAIDASGDLIATAGYMGRLGRVSLEPTVKIFDVRMGLRMLATIPFAAGPSLLRFHPQFPTTLLVASASGMFTFTDATGMGGGLSDIYGVDTGGGALMACDISPSGQCVAFGGEGGYLHLWACTDTPCASLGGDTPQMPDTSENPPPPSIFDYEDDVDHHRRPSSSHRSSFRPRARPVPFSMIPIEYPPDNSGYASDIGHRDIMSVGLAPRVVDASVLACGKKVDGFVLHIENSRYVRGGRPGQSAAAIAPLRNRRIQPRSGAEDAEKVREGRAAARAAAGGIMLPGRYRRVAIKQQTGVKFEEFDFSYYNKTPFSGLENDLANCYINALLHVLFFCRPMRDLAMTHAPNPDAEFSLMGELSLLFRMLATAGGAVCAAANLLRALRQNKEALALGLLEGVRGERGSMDIEVEAQKDKSLARRTQRLFRFLLEQLSREVGQGQQQQQHQVEQQSPIESIFAIVQQQKTECLSKQRPVQEKTTRTFQVDLQYPPPKDRPSVTVADTGSNTSTADQNRPSFSDILAASLRPVNEMRAWYDEVVSYQHVKQQRCPLSLPQVMVVNCGLEDKADVAWWQPCTVTTDDDSTSSNKNKKAVKKKAWLPLAVSVTVDPSTWSVTVREGQSVDDETLLAGVHSNRGDACGQLVQEVYELTGVVAHIVDEDEAAEGGAEYEGHLLAHLSVPETYYSAQLESPMTSRPGSRASTGVEVGGDQGVGDGEEYSIGIHHQGLEQDSSLPPATPVATTNNRQHPRRWLLFNDFHISPCLPEEVSEIYGGQKTPVLLFFTRQDELKTAVTEFKQTYK